MSSGFPGGGDFYGIGGGSTVRSPIQVPYQQRSDGDGAGGALSKRPLTELERQQLQHALLLRSVKQKTLQTSPISPLSPVDFSSSSTSSASSVLRPSEAFASYSSASSAPRKGSYLFLQQQLLLQQQQQQQQTHQSYNRPNPNNFAFSPPLSAATQTEPEKTGIVTMKDRLQELERQLLDDDEEEEHEASISGSAVTTNEWNETMQNLISPCSSPQKPPSPSPSSSSSSSSSSSPSSSTAPRQLLLDTASAIADGNIEAAATTLDRLKRTNANPRGDPDQRLTTYMVAALHSRINPSSSSPDGRPPPIAELCSTEHRRATQLLYESSPCFSLGFVAANLAILEATISHPKIHIVDFDIGQGLQYVALVNALAELTSSSSTGRPTVKITAVADPTSPLNPFGVKSSSGSLKMVGDRIAKQAERAGVDLRFNVVCRKTSDLDASTLGCEPDEALAVNFAFLLYRMPDESVSPENPRDELLRRVKALSPLVVTLVEQEMNCNTAPFAARFAEAASYYGALFESLDATMARESADRVRLEECLGRKAANSVAREGRERVERCEVFGKWRARIGMAGFHPIPLGPAVAESARARLGLAGAKNPLGFTVKEEAGGLCLGWMGRMLTVVSAWR